MRMLACVIGCAVACSCSHKSASSSRTGASSREELADRAFAALRAGDANAYRALLPEPRVIPRSCKWSAKFRRALPEIAQDLDQRFAECQHLLDWAKAKVTPHGYSAEPGPEGGCPPVIGHGEARFDISVGSERYEVTIDDVMEIGGRFYVFDTPQCHKIREPTVPAAP